MLGVFAFYSKYYIFETAYFANRITKCFIEQLVSGAEDFQPKGFVFLKDVWQSFKTVDFRGLYDEKAAEAATGNIPHLSASSSTGCSACDLVSYQCT